MPADDIPQALADLRDGILNGEYAYDVLTEISEGYGIPEQVLRVRFEKAYDRTIEQFSWVEVVTTDRLQEAVDRAARRYEISPFHSKHVGRRFWHEGEWYRYICQSKNKIITVKESTEGVWWFSGEENFEVILRQIGLR